MQLLHIIYSNAVDEEMVEIIKRSTNGYTKFLDVQGEGHGEPHLGNHIWPSLNNCIITLCDAKTEKSIAAEIENLRKKFPTIGIRIISSPVDRVY